MVSDGDGGVIVAWQDDRDGVWRIYLQRVNASGMPLWSAGGVRVSYDTTNQVSSRIGSDGSGGAVVEWENDEANGYRRYSVQRISSIGALMWGNNGVTILDVNSSNGFSWATVNDFASDGRGGAFFLYKGYQKSSSSYNYLGIGRVTGSGTIPWTGAFEEDWYPLALSGSIVADSTGGLIVGWLHEPGLGPPSFNSNQLNLGRMDSTGSWLWKMNLMSDSSQQSIFEYTMCPDRNGGVYLCWAGATPNGVPDTAERVSMGSTLMLWGFAIGELTVSSCAMLRGIKAVRRSLQARSVGQLSAGTIFATVLLQIYIPRASQTQVCCLGQTTESQFAWLTVRRQFLALCAMPKGGRRWSGTTNEMSSLLCMPSCSTVQANHNGLRMEHR